jgi:hypothetical protein
MRVSSGFCGAAVLVALALAAFVLVGAAGPSQSATVIARKRAEVAADGYRQAKARFTAGVCSLEDVYVWSVRRMDAERDAESEKVKVAAQNHLERMTELQTEVESGVKAGVQPAIASTAATYFRLEAQEWIERGGR